MTFIFRFCCFLLLLAPVIKIQAQEDTLSRKKRITYFLNWKDSYLNRFNYTLPPLLGLYPNSERASVQYNLGLNRFELEDKIEDKIDVKIPQSMSFNEYSSLQNAMVRKSILRDIEKAQDGTSTFAGKKLKPVLQKNKIFDRIFGDKIPEFRPNGYINLSLSFLNTYSANPTIPISRREQSRLDFDQQVAINFNNLLDAPNSGDLDNLPTGNPNGVLNDVQESLNKVGQVKEKLGILGNIDTQAAFNFQNKFKLNFKNEPEDILQKLEFGNISFPIRNQLIPGVQDLFGVKTALRFGKLDVTAVVAQQRSRTESIFINGGTQSRDFEIRADNYEENRHFFLGDFFKKNYPKSLSRLPAITSQVRITRVEVYVTNRTYTTTSNRSFVAFTDLPEDQRNISNSDLFKLVDNFSGSTPSDSTFSNYLSASLTSQGLQNGTEFEVLKGARKLEDREFSVHPELGYVSLNTPLRNDEVLAVAYEYTYRGQPRKVGLLSEDITKISSSEPIVLKLLKSSNTRNNIQNQKGKKLWDLMMKNIYSLSQGAIVPEGFRMRVIYKDDNTGLDTPQLKEGGADIEQKTIVELMGADYLNYNNDQLPDGNFDYIPNVTIDEQYGRIIFPVLEPFGSSLKDRNPGLDPKFIFNELYEKTLSDAQQITLKNKYFIQGQLSSGSSDILLPLGASGSSVKVFSGGTELKSGLDYTVDDQLGVIKITNESLLSSGRSIRIDYEKPDLFQTQIRRLFGLRLDYSISSYMRLGGTLLNLRENTVGSITRVPIGNEPVKNTLWGLDFHLKEDFSGITRVLDKLPGLETKEPSAVILNAEFAQLLPGVNNKSIKGNALIDDFEQSKTITDLSRDLKKWNLGSVPEDFQVKSPNLLEINNKRAKIALYNIDPTIYLNSESGLGTNAQIPDYIRNQANANIYERGYQVQDIFPGKSVALPGLQQPSQIMDIAYFPSEPGMYNYNSDLTSRGLLKDPKNNFGSVMRGLTFDADFDNANIEYLEFWMLDPFADRVRDGSDTPRQNQTGGKLVLQLGDISEDVIPDGYYSFENGYKLEYENNLLPIQTDWGFVPRSPYVNDYFDNIREVRAIQDVGLDGASNENELNLRGVASYISKIQSVVSPTVLERIKTDPAKDDFTFFLDTKFDQSASLIERYKNYLGSEGNSPFIENSRNSSINTVNIEINKEDVNQDNSINEIDQYYEYEIELFPDGNRLKPNKYVVDKVTRDGVTWYLHRIPIRKPDRSIPSDFSGFKSIRFVRMVTKEWEEPVVMRFATMQLISNSYRLYTNDLSESAASEISKTYPDDEVFTVNAVNVEQNGCDNNGNCNVKEGEIPYVVPPGFIRDRDFTNQFIVQFNEQSISFRAENLAGGEKRAAFKNTKIDMNLYKRLKMFIHAHNPNNEEGNAGAFIRLGTDAFNNYYEIAIPKLKTTINTNLTGQNSGSVVSDPFKIWPSENDIDIPLDILRQVKLERNRSGSKLNERYTKKRVEVTGGIEGSGDYNALQSIIRTYDITVVGNPDLSNVLNIMLGVSNPNTDLSNKANFTVWMDELRAFQFDTQSGEAGIISADIKLADLGNVNVNANFRTFGFGGVQERVSNRSRDFEYGFGINTNLLLEKFFPERYGLVIPVNVSFEKQRIKPTYNPLDPDILLADALKNKNEFQNSLTEKLATSEVTSKSFNITNARKIFTSKNKELHFYNVENFSFTFAHSKTSRNSIFLANEQNVHTRAAISYQFQPKSKPWEPFNKLNKKSQKWLKEFNLNPIPSIIAFNTDYQKHFFFSQYRDKNLETKGTLPNTFKSFLGLRQYDIQWNLTKSIRLAYNATMVAIVDDINQITDQEPDFIKGLTKLGRAKDFKQSVLATYKLPFDRFYYTDWIKADLKYETKFFFNTGSFQTNGAIQTDANGSADPLGHLISNGRELGINGQVDLVQLYNKFKFLKNVGKQEAPKEIFSRTPGSLYQLQLPNDKKNAANAIKRLLMSVRGINTNFALFETTMLPGFLYAPRMFGLDTKNDVAPGLGFVLGSQQSSIFEKSINRQWLSKSTIQYNPFVQTKGIKFEYGTSFEPFNGLRLQIKGRYQRGDSYEFQYNSGSPNQLAPYRNGNYSMTFFSFKTWGDFLTDDEGGRYPYKLYDNFLENRATVLDRLNGLSTSGENYHQNSQDVLIPAFFAAYSGRDLNKMFDRSAKRYSKSEGKRGSNGGFNPFLGLPLPNWRLDFGGLEKLPALNQIFESFTITHEYSSSYTMGNYSSSLDYTDPSVLNLKARGYYLGDQINTLNNLFSPVFIFSSVAIEEKFSPLIGFQFATKGNFSGSLNYNRERGALLNLSNALIQENFMKGFNGNINLRRNNVKLPIRGRDGNFVVLKNDLNFRLDMQVMDSKILVRYLDGHSVPTGGSGYLFLFKPSIQYQINKRISTQMSYQKTVTNPFLTNTYYQSNSAFSINARINLSE